VAGSGQGANRTFALVDSPHRITLERFADADDQEFLGLRARQDFRAINFWEIDAEEVWRQHPAYPSPPAKPLGEFHFLERK
jgi:hypothetical protein